MTKEEVIEDAKIMTEGSDVDLYDPQSVSYHIGTLRRLCERLDAIKSYNLDQEDRDLITVIHTDLRKLERLYQDMTGEAA